MTDEQLGIEILRLIHEGDVSKMIEVARSNDLKLKFEERDNEMGGMNYHDLMDAVREKNVRELTCLLGDLADYLIA